METQEIIGTFTGHLGPVFSCMWSPLDPDYLISGSADFTVQIWKISEQEAIMPTEKPTSRKIKTKKKKNHIDKSSSIVKNNENEDEISKMKSSESQNSINAEKKNNNSKKDSKKRAYFPIYSKRLNSKTAILASIRTLLKSIKGENESEDEYKKQEADDNENGENSEDVGDGKNEENKERKEKVEEKLETNENNDTMESNENDKTLETDETNVPSIFAGKEQILDIIKEESKIIVLFFSMKCLI